MVNGHIFMFIVGVSWNDVKLSAVCFIFPESTHNLSCFATGQLLSVVLGLRFGVPLSILQVIKSNIVKFSRHYNKNAQ